MGLCREREREPCCVPMCRHRCSAAAAEGLCEAGRGADAVRATCGMCGEMAEEDLTRLRREKDGDKDDKKVETVLISTI